MYATYKIVPFCPYHFVRTILSNTILSVPFCPYHFVRTILSATILSGHPTNIFRDIHTFLHKCMNSYIKQAPFPPIMPSSTDNGKMIFIHSFRIFLKRLFKSTTTRRCSRPQQLTLYRSLYAEALQTTVSEGLAQGPWRDG